VINSPVKKQIAERAGKLMPLIKRKHPIVGVGAQSVVLANGHNEVYVITRTTVAQNIELLRDLPSDPSLFSVPRVVGINEDLAKLISPQSPDKTKKQVSKQYHINYPQLWMSNIVYVLPRYDGTLEDLKGLRFNEDSIIALQETLSKALTVLHTHGLSHNDVSLRNIFYKGQAPHLQFFLGDFGSVTKNSENHHENCAKDFLRLQRVTDKAREILARKVKHVQKIKNVFRSIVPNFDRQRKDPETSIIPMEIERVGETKLIFRSLVQQSFQDLAPLRKARLK
jgi:hypothetical protein